MVLRKLIKGHEWHLQLTWKRTHFCIEKKNEDGSRDFPFGFSTGFGTALKYDPVKTVRIRRGWYFDAVANVKDAREGMDVGGINWFIPLL